MCLLLARIEQFEARLGINVAEFFVASACQENGLPTEIEEETWRTKRTKKHKRELVPLDQVNRLVPLKLNAQALWRETFERRQQSIRHQVFGLPEINRGHVDNVRLFTDGSLSVQ